EAKNASASESSARTGTVSFSVSSGATIVAPASWCWSVAFVAVSYSALLLLLRSLRAYELADAAERGPLRRRVWALSALLTAMFAWKVAAAVAWWPAAVIVWAAAAATSAGGFLALSLHRR
ncbi:hypothetical protein BS78_10G039600, partial [Paspalum vaginatum]